MMEYSKKLELKRINKKIDLSLLKGIEEKLNPENCFFKSNNYNLEILNLDDLIRLIDDYDKPVRVAKKMIITSVLYILYYLICKLFGLSLGLISIGMILFFILLGIGIFFLWEVEEEYLIFDSYNLLISLLMKYDYNFKSYDYTIIDSRLCVSLLDSIRVRGRYYISKLFKVERKYYIFEYGENKNHVFEVLLKQDENLSNKEVELNFGYLPYIRANEYTFNGFGQLNPVYEEDEEYSEDLDSEKYEDNDTVEDSDVVEEHEE